jgi:hypothetical protein
VLILKRPSGRWNIQVKNKNYSIGHGGPNNES